MRNHTDLFSGIGGFALAAQRTGYTTTAFCENDPYCQRILNKHWPGVPIHDDVRTFDGTPHRGAALVTGGFPCQDISAAGKQTGIDGERSGLWEHLCRIIGEIRPDHALVENVPMLLAGDRGRWFQRILGDLAEIRFDAEWHSIPASAIGAPHRRDRVWIVAYPRSERRQQVTQGPHGDEGPDEGRAEIQADQSQRNGEGHRTRDVADAEGERERSRVSGRSIELDGPEPRRDTVKCSPAVADANGKSEGWPPKPRGQRGQWEFEPNVGRVAHGIPRRVDRLRGLGNAIVPQVAEMILRELSTE